MLNIPRGFFSNHMLCQMSENETQSYSYLKQRNLGISANYYLVVWVCLFVFN